MNEALAWLLEEGGPIIRYRAATELADSVSRRERGALEADLLASPLVRTWLARVTPRTGFNDVHGSKPTCLETALGKLVQLGCRAGMAPLDRRTRPLRRWLSQRFRATDGLPALYSRNVAAKFLFMAGYREPAIRHIVTARLELVSRFARQKRYDVYVNPEHYPGFPRAFAGRPLVDPALCPRGETPLPSIRDLHAFAAWRPKAGEQTRRQIDAVARYVCHPDYDRLFPGYGVAQLGARRFWAIGWDVRLPDPTARPSGLVLQNLQLLAHFPSGRRMPRLRRWLAELESFRTSAGRYLFPRPFLPERPGTYWVAGNLCGLEEKRRARRALELESTFYALRIKSLLA